jgi:hypothetical protein
VYENHSTFEISHDGSTKIWRYIDFTKFVSMLDKKSLFFCRSDRLSDSFEGSTTKANIKSRQEMFRQHEAYIDDILQRHSESCREYRNKVNVNCWHINNYESAAMWKLYLKSNEGIAIQTTINRLKESFKNTSKPVFIGEVKYIDYDNDHIPENNIIYSYLHKRKSFEYEQELRVIYPFMDLVGPDENGVLFSYAKIDEMGYYIEVDLDILIDKIFVSPVAPEWFCDLVKSILEMYHINKEVVRSNLAKDPIY